MPVAQRVQFNGNQLCMGVIFFHFINSSMPGWPALLGELPNHADNSSLLFINSVCCTGELGSAAPAHWEHLQCDTLRLIQPQDTTGEQGTNTCK